MNKILMAALYGLTFICAIFIGQVHAGEELNAVNAEVEKKAEEIDRKYGVLLTTQEWYIFCSSICVFKLRPYEVSQSYRAVSHR